MDERLRTATEIVLLRQLLRCRVGEVVAPNRCGDHAQARLGERLHKLRALVHTLPSADQCLRLGRCRRRRRSDGGLSRGLCLLAATTTRREDREEKGTCDAGADHELVLCLSRPGDKYLTRPLEALPGTLSTSMVPAWPFVRHLPSRITCRASRHPRLSAVAAKLRSTLTRWQRFASTAAANLRNVSRPATSGRTRRISSSRTRSDGQSIASVFGSVWAPR